MGGHKLRVIRNWCRKHQIEVELMGVDINPHCIAFAQSRSENKAFHKVCGEYIRLESWNFIESLGVPLSDMQLPIVNKLMVTASKGTVLNNL